MPAKGVDRPGPGDNFATVRSAPWNEVFLPCVHRNPLPVNNQRVAALHDQHVFIEFVIVSGRRSGLVARPECHLASVQAVKDVAFNTGSCLIRGRNPVCRVLHEFREVVHSGTYSLEPSGTIDIRCGFPPK